MQVGSIPSAFQSGLEGVKKAEQGVEDAALQINRLNAESDRIQDANRVATEQQGLQQPQIPSLEAEAVNLIVNEHLAKANTKVIKTADEMVGTLIDTKV